MIRRRSPARLFILCLILAASFIAFASSDTATALRSKLTSQEPARRHVSTSGPASSLQIPDFSNHRSRNLSAGDATLLPVRPTSSSHPMRGSPRSLLNDSTRVQSDDSAFIRFPSGLISSLDQGADSCPAYLIPSAPFADSGTTIGRRDNFAVSCNWNNGNPDVIYQFTPEQTGFYQVIFTHHFSNMLFVVREGGECPGDTETVCGWDTAYVLDLVSGTNYYFIIDAYYTSPGSGSYMFYLTGPAPCHLDFDIVAPDSVSGNTFMAGDHCPVSPGDDQMVRVVIPHTGRWNFSLCDGQDWYAGLYLMRQCCGPVISGASDGCPYSESSWVSRPILFGQDLEAGEYFLDIEGTECGAWTLKVTECTVFPPNDSCGSVTPAALPTVFTGDNTCATRDCALWGDESYDVWHAFVLDSTSDVALDYCGTSDEISSVASYLVQGCPCENTIWYDYYDYHPCGDENIIRIFFLGLPAGIYYIPIVGYDNYNHGPYTISVSSPPSCSITRGPADLEECPETPGPDHSWNDCNGGCNDSIPTYQNISLTDTIYGRAFTYPGPSGYDYRDTDWYQFAVTDTVVVAVTVTGEFPLAVGIFEIPDCDQLRIRAWTATHTRCDTLIVASECLLPGSYVLFIAPNMYSGLDDPVHYRAFLSTTECELCRIVEQPGDVPEGEPDCHTSYVDSINSGCNWYGTYSDISVGETVYGNAGVYWFVYQSGDSVLYRDTDWYRFTVTEHCFVSWTVEADFPALIALCGCCDDEFDCAFDVADIPPCQPVTLNSGQCLGPGTYVTYVATSDWGPYPCGSHYRGSLTSEPCTTCDTTLALANDIIENEPVCGPGFVDSTNGGCNSDPPVFSPPLACGQTIIGTSGTTWNNNGSIRDTDWFPISIPGTQSVVLNWCVFAQFSPMITILRAGNCDSLTTVSEIVTGNACDTVCTMNAVPPGDYWLFVSPADFHSTTCNSQYRAWTFCAPCNPDTVRDVTIRRVGNTIVLRWSAQMNFTGTFSVYAVSDLGVTLLQSNIAPVFGDSRTVVADTTALENIKFYYVTSFCP